MKKVDKITPSSSWNGQALVMLAMIMSMTTTTTTTTTSKGPSVGAFAFTTSSYPGANRPPRHHHHDKIAAFKSYDVTFVRRSLYQNRNNKSITSGNYGNGGSIMQLGATDGKGDNVVIDTAASENELRDMDMDSNDDGDTNVKVEEGTVSDKDTAAVIVDALDKSQAHDEKKDTKSINSNIKSKSNKGSRDKSDNEITETTTKEKKKISKPRPKSTREELKTFSARFLDDNGLTITTDEDGALTARPNNIVASQSKSKSTSTKSKSKSKESSEQSKGNSDSDTKAEVSSDLTTKRKPSPTKQKSNTTTSKSTIQQQQQQQQQQHKPNIIRSPPTIEPLKENIPKPITSEFNVVLTHCTADFDSLASAVGLAKLWSHKHPSSYDNIDSDDTDNNNNNNNNNIMKSSEFESSSNLPTFVVLPRGAHPSVQKFLSLHKHLFPIRSLRSLPTDLSVLNRLGLVDAQRRERIGPAESLLSYATRVTIVDHHIDGESDIPEATDYVCEKVGSVSTMVAERLRSAGLSLTEAEATLLALGIHGDTGSLCYDSTTTRDAEALAWIMGQGASQAAIAEHAKASLSVEQQGVLTNALVNTNSTLVHGVTVSTVLLTADGFINGLAAVTQDALELSSSDIFLLAVVYDPKSGGKSKKRKNSADNGQFRLQSKLLSPKTETNSNNYMMEAEAWKGGEEALRRRRLRAAFDKKDTDGSGYLERGEINAVLAKSGVIASEDALASLMESMDADGDGRIDFEEFVAFTERVEELQKQQERLTGRRPTTMTIIGRVKAGINMKDVNLNRLFQQFGGGGHAKAASCTARLEDESEAEEILQGLVDELIETSLMKQPTVCDFMTSPVLSAKPSMTEKQVEDLFTRYDVRALPVVDDNNDVIGLVTYKEVAKAKQRLWNKEQKKIRQKERPKKNKNSEGKDQRGNNQKRRPENRKVGNALKGWMKQHIQVVDSSRTMAEVEAILLETDVGCIPVVADGTKQLIGMVTRTDLLRQHRYYNSLHYHNKGFADSIAARKPIIELRKKLKKFDLEE